MAQTSNLQYLISQSRQFVFSKHDTTMLQWKHKGNSVFSTILKISSSEETQCFIWETQGGVSQTVLYFGYTI